MQAHRVHISRDDYLEREEQSAERHEFVNGQVFSMSGASWAHNVITTNVIRSIGVEDGCFVVSNDMRVRVAEDAYLYPDVVVVCGEPSFETQKRTSLTNPRVILEVLSPSTEQWDRGGKFQLYQGVPSLQAYVLVSQHEARVEVFYRGEGDWRYQVFGPGDDLVLPSLTRPLPVATLYAGTDPV